MNLFSHSLNKNFPLSFWNGTNFCFLFLNRNHRFPEFLCIIVNGRNDKLRSKATWETNTVWDFWGLGVIMGSRRKRFQGFFFIVAVWKFAKKCFVGGVQKPVVLNFQSKPQRCRFSFHFSIDGNGLLQKLLVLMVDEKQQRPQVCLLIWAQIKLARKKGPLSAIEHQLIEFADVKGAVQFSYRLSWVYTAEHFLLNNSL